MNRKNKLLSLIILTVWFSTIVYSQQIIKKNEHYFIEDFKLHEDENIDLLPKNPSNTNSVNSLPIVKEDFIVNSFDGKYGSDKVRPQIAIDGQGNYAVTWIDIRNGYNQIFVQFYDKNDNKVGEEMAVNETPTDWNNAPSITANSQGDFIIAWCHSSESIFAQRMNKYGNKIGNNFQLNSIHGYNIGIPSVAIRKNGSFVAVWSNYHFTNNHNLYARTFDYENRPIGEEIVINDLSGNGGTSSGYGRQIAVDGVGNLGITWSGVTNKKSCILFQQLDTNSQKIGNNILISDTTNSVDYYFPSIAGLKSGTFIISWEGQGVQSRIYNTYSGFITDQLTIYNSKYSWLPSSVSSDGESFFFISWSGSSTMKSQKINAATGELVGEINKFSFNNADSMAGTFCYLSNCSENNMYLVFQKYDNSYSQNIFIQKYNSEYSFIDELKNISNDKQSSWQTNPSIKTNSDGISLVLWQDLRNGKNELYGQIFNKDFDPVGENFQVNTSDDFLFFVDVKFDVLSDGNFIVVYNGGNYNSKPRIYLTKISSVGKIIKSTYIEDWNLDEYELNLGVNLEDDILIVFSNRYWNYTYSQLFNSNLEAKTKVIQLLKTTPNKIYNSLSLSINKNLETLATWNYYDKTNNTYENNILGIMYNKFGKEISDTLIISSKLDNSAIINIESNFDNSRNYIVLLKDRNYLTIIRNYIDVKEPIISSYSLYSYNTNFEFQFFKNRKAMFTETTDDDVYLYYVNDNNHKISKEILYRFDPFTRYQIDYYNKNSTSLIDNDLFFIYESNKNENTGYDIWANVRSISYADTTQEITIPFANDDKLFPISPNPISSNAIISFRIFSYYNVKISLYNILGQKVKVLYDNPTEAGYYQIPFNASDLSSGVYFISMDAFKRKTQKIIVIK